MRPAFTIPTSQRGVYRTEPDGGMDGAMRRRIRSLVGFGGCYLSLCKVA